MNFTTTCFIIILLCASNAAFGQAAQYQSIQIVNETTGEVKSVDSTASVVVKAGRILITGRIIEHSNDSILVVNKNRAKTIAVADVKWIRVHRQTDEERTRTGKTVDTVLKITGITFIAGSLIIAPVAFTLYLAGVAMFNPIPYLGVMLAGVILNTSSSAVLSDRYVKKKGWRLVVN